MSQFMMRKLIFLLAVLELSAVLLNKSETAWGVYISDVDYELAHANWLFQQCEKKETSPSFHHEFFHLQTNLWKKQNIYPDMNYWQIRFKQIKIVSVLAIQKLWEGKDSKYRITKSRNFQINQTMDFFLV